MIKRIIDERNFRLIPRKCSVDNAPAAYATVQARQSPIEPDGN